MPKYRRSGLAKKAYKIAKKNRRMLKQREVKFVDATASGTTIEHTTGIVVYLSPVAEGDGSNQRIGDYINAKSLHMRLALIGNAADPSQIIRVVIFRKNDDTNTAPTMHGTTTTDYLQLANPLSHTTSRQTLRYIPLYDETFVGNPDGTENWVRKIYFKLKGLPVHYLDTANTSTSSGRHSLWMGIFTDAVDTEEAAVSYSCRFTYVDP